MTNTTFEAKYDCCPFCGGEATIFTDYCDITKKQYWNASCKNSGCFIQPKTHFVIYSKEAALQHWNARAIKEES